MGAVVKLNALQGVSRAALPLVLHGDPWMAATNDKRQEALVREAFIAPWQVWGGSASSAAQRLHWGALACSLPTSAQHAAELLGGAPSVVTIKRWLLAYAKEGRLGLLDNRAGKRRLAQTWHQQAAMTYNRPSKPTYAAVTKDLQAMGFADAQEHLVRTYLQALPARLGAVGPARVGPALHRLTLQKFQPRTLDNQRPGVAYAGDGHTIDCYVAHPNTGKLWRPELTLFLDIKSRLPVGWWLGNSENAVDTLRALGHAMVTHGHVPPMLYLDHGAGYRAKMMSAESVGFAAQMGIDITAAIPGNPHGKGWIERFFRTVRDHHDKFFAQGEFYCGDDMAPEINRRLSTQVQTGKRRLPMFADYVQSVAAFFKRYSSEPMDVLDGRTPLQVWTAERIAPIDPVYDVTELIRPMDTAMVRRQTVTLHKRTYYHDALIDYQAQVVRVRYDLHDDAHLWIYDEKNRFVCQAALQTKVFAIPTSRIDEATKTAEVKAIERKLRQVAEIRARNQNPIDAATQWAAIDALTPSLPATPAQLAAPQEPDFEVDLTTWRKDI